MRNLHVILGSIALVLTAASAVFLARLPEIPELLPQAGGSGATLSLLPEEGAVTPEGLQVSILLTTENTQIDGVDAILYYEADKVQVDPALSPGALFSGENDRVVANEATVDNETGIGTIKFSALTLSPTSKNGILATFNVKPTNIVPESQATPINFDFTLGSTIDSNVAEHGTGSDILVKVRNGSYVSY